MVVQDDHGDYIARIYRATPSGPKFHPAAPNFPILWGPRRICGEVVGVVRDYRGEEE